MQQGFNKKPAVKRRCAGYCRPEASGITGRHGDVQASLLYDFTLNGHVPKIHLLRLMTDSTLPIETVRYK